MEDSILAHESRWAIRQIWRNPGFALTVVLTIGIGIGANLAIFQLLHAVLFVRLPIPAPEQIYSLHSVKSPFDAQWIFSYPAYQRLNKETAGIAPVIAHSGISEGLLKAQEHSGERIRYQLVSANFFDVLGLAPQLGRFFYFADDQVGAENLPAVLGSEYWRRSFVGDAKVIGRHVTLYRLVLRPSGWILLAGILPGLLLTQGVRFVARNFEAIPLGRAADNRQLNRIDLHLGVSRHQTASWLHGSEVWPICRLL